MEILSLILLGILFAITTLNFFTAFRLKQKTAAFNSPLPFVSVLVPARNEAFNLTHLIPSLLQSNYPNFEIIILDDESSDQTFNTAEKLLQNSKVPFQIIKGQSWSQDRPASGKNFACHQLSQIAQGKILVFCDADVMISKSALSSTVQLMLKNPNASGVSALAFLKTPSFLQSLVLPWIMQIPLMMTLPLRFAWRLPFPSLQMANGQWLAIWTDQYKKMGGHLALGHSVVEDVEIARKLIHHSLGGMIPALSAKEVSVSMYADWKSMVEGFSKNLISIYGGHPFAFITALATLNLIFFSPLFISDTMLSVAGFMILFSLRFLSSLAFSHSIFRSVFDGLLIWPSLLIVNYFSVLILKNHFFKITQWKGRTVFQPGSSV
jgi:glycosyltransferase involved in cell wall biosynthesis